MFKRKEKSHTPRQKAQKAQLGIAARLGGCALLISFVVKLLRMSPEDGGPSMTVKVVVAVVFVGATIAIVTMTALDFYRSWKLGMYNEGTYLTPEDIAEAEALKARDGELDEPADDESDTDDEGEPDEAAPAEDETPEEEE